MAKLDKRVVWTPMPCKLSDQEMLERSLALASEIEARIQTDLERKDCAAEFKDRLAKHDSSISRLSSTLRSGKEQRSVECHDICDPGRKVWDRFRQDTHELVSSYAMSMDELQVDLEQRAKEKKAEEEAAAQKSLELQQRELTPAEQEEAKRDEERSKLFGNGKSEG